MARANGPGKQRGGGLEEGCSSSDDSALAGLSDDEAPGGGRLLQRAFGDEYRSAWQAAGSEENEEAGSGGGVDDVGLARLRAAKARKLLQVYELEYWGLMGELHTKHARFCARSGGADGIRKQPGDIASQPCAEGAALGKGGQCAAKLCKLRPVELSNYCLGHIAQDKDQCLY